LLGKKHIKSNEDFAEVEHDQTGTGEKEGKGYLKRVEQRAEKATRREEKILGSCRFCLPNGLLKEEEILSISDNVFLLQPNLSRVSLRSPVSWKALLASALLACEVIQRGNGAGAGRDQTVQEVLG